MLEEPLGVGLFLFNSNGAVAMREGQLVLQLALWIESEISRFIGQIGRERANPVTIRVAGSAGIHTEFLPEFAAFGQLYPNSRVKLIVAIDSIEALTQRRADIAIALERTVPRRVAGVQLATLSQANYRRKENEASNAVLGWGEEIELLLPRHWTIANRLESDRAAARFNSWLTLRRGVAAGMGRASWLCFLAHGDSELERIDDPDPRFDTGLWLLHRTTPPQSVEELASTEFLAARIASRLGSPEFDLDARR